MIHKKRKDYIADIIKYGVNVRITIPTTLLHEKTLEKDSFKTLRDSLAILQADEELVITTTDLEDGLSCICISLKPEETAEEETTTTPTTTG